MGQLISKKKPEEPRGPASPGPISPSAAEDTGSTIIPDSCSGGTRPIDKNNMDPSTYAAEEPVKKELFSRPHRAVDGQNYQFEAASPDMRELLINLAVKANDIYGTRTADDETARRVFDVIPERHFSNGGITEVLKHRGDIVGFIAVAMHDVEEEGTKRHSVELNHLTVKKSFQRSGYGTRLWHRLLELGMRHKWQKIEWFSDSGAEQFFTKMGATRVGTSENLLAPASELPSFEYCFS